MLNRLLRKTSVRLLLVWAAFTGAAVVTGMGGAVATATPARASVPEPGTMLMLGIGAAGLIAARRKARRG